MKLIRLQNNTPDVYTYESRDFQLFCRLYDCINNGLLYDTDTITDIINTSMCRSTLLSLLKDKLGFFADVSNLDDQSIRMILQAFPILIKNKGSFSAVVKCVNVFLKILGIDAVYSVFEKMDEYKIIINIESQILDTSTLKMMLEYVMPAGMGLEINNVNTFKLSADQYENSDSVKVLFISDSYNSNLRGSSTDDNIPSGTTTGFKTRIGAVDSMKIKSSDSPNQNIPDPEIYPQINQNDT